MRQGQPSVTAQRVAVQRLSFARQAAPFGDPEAEDALARDVAGSVRADPGPMSTYLAGRTTFFDRVLLSAIERGVTQVVVTAAGYDGRSLRYAKTGVRWFEVDHPATQSDKLERLGRLGIASDHVAYVGADFTIDDVGAALAGTGHDISRATLFLCEGIAVYLDLEVLASLIGSLRSRAADRSRLALSLSVAGAAEGLDERRQRFETTVAAIGEPTRSRLTPDQAQTLFASAGWGEVGIGASDGSSARARRAGLVLLEPT
jgi:methyltransferase (TIGR00027 family)